MTDPNDDLSSIADSGLPGDEPQEPAHPRAGAAADPGGDLSFDDPDNRGTATPESQASQGAPLGPPD
ncbi:hypothetical protein [Actinoplanes sp. DH11]|uniref:hypothetical protein n=1 Tax=Actinoplanes sp. DH11 TaxID=2857011 RepID=UPI001E313711|nr:hypothetical protein [Actinoplanes sp. DH11]